MKIEIWYEVKTVHGDIINRSRVVRVPPDIKQIDSNNCREIMERWIERVQRIDYYQRYRFYNRVHDYHGEVVSRVKIKGWAPVIKTEVLEFLCSKL